MSDYSLQVVWSGKDAAGGIISGDDFHDEFTEVQGAVNSKADIASPGLTGIPTAPTALHTASTTTNTTQLATTAFVHLVKESLYPVGTIFTTTSDASALATSAAEVTALMGFGTWLAFGAGKVLVGLDSTDADFDDVGSGTNTNSTTGRKDSVLPEHTHTVPMTDVPDVELIGSSTTTISELTGTSSTATDSTGVVLTGNENLQPYVVVYMWKRTA
tara:strand:+ start:178 stop:825 length:648 start_codon:yes stop_codon:yes gene_type:complete